MSVLICKMCGGNLEFIDSDSVCECDHCGRRQTIPQINDEKKLSLFNRANQLRADCDFDKASNVYEALISEFPSEAEAYWGLVLCKFGIEYVDDPLTHNKIPTCHRSSFNSVFDDEDYKATIENASVSARLLYEAEAKQIEEIRLGILDISEKEEPYDVFICFKEHDKFGDRTPESIMAQEIYEILTDKGYKVFFSRITLEDILGKEYEPYIFAALNSAKVMLAFGTSAEHYNSVWVKNEWSRFLQLIASGHKKTLIPCYADMEIEDMPAGFSKRQAQNMAKLGWQQDLIRGIEKLIPREEAPKEKIIIKEAAGNPSVDSLLKRVFIFLEDSDWKNADDYAEKVLDIDPENAEAYLGKLMSELQVRKKALLKDLPKVFDNNSNYGKIMRYADFTLKKEIADYNNAIDERNKYNKGKSIYDEATMLIPNAKTCKDYKEIARRFSMIPYFKDAAELAREYNEKSDRAYNVETYAAAMEKYNSDNPKVIREAKELFSLIEDFMDSAARAAECESKARLTENSAVYKRAKEAFDSADPAKIRSAQKLFESISDYKDSDVLASQCEQKATTVQARKICNEAKINLNGSNFTAIDKSIKELGTIIGFENADELREKLIAKKDSIIKANQQKQREREAAEKQRIKKAKTKKAAKASVKIIAVLTVLCTIGAVLFITLWVAPKDKYDTAIEHFNNGEYEEAISLFSEIKHFKDSKNKISEVKYAYAEHMLDNGDIDGAYLLYSELAGYNENSGKFLGEPYLDSKEKRTEVILNNPRLAKVGDVIIFGSYEQDKNTENGKEEIRWKVLENNASQLYLISEDALDFQPWSEGSSGYHKTWSESSIRYWLNDSFYNSAFSEEEKSSIVTATIHTSTGSGSDTPEATTDHVFLLDIDEFTDEEKYHFIFEDYTLTEYAASLADTASDYFWLRTPGSGGGAYMRYDALNNSFDAGISSRWGYEGGYVRPCIYLDISEQ